MRYRLGWLGIGGLLVTVLASVGWSVPVLATAVSGNGKGGLVGCYREGYTYFVTTCNGATWEWYEWPTKSTSNVTILANGDLYIYGTDDVFSSSDNAYEASPGGTIPASCKEAGGYWRYAMLAMSSRSRNGISFVEGDQVGISALNGGDGGLAYRSAVFGDGGGMTYRGTYVSGSYVSDSWSMVREQFYEARDAGYTDGFTQWDSNLGAFCYGEGVKKYNTTWESSTSATLTVGNQTVLSGTSGRSSSSKTNATNTIGTYTITSDTISSAKITWRHNLYRTDSESRTGKTGYLLYRNGTKLFSNWKTAILASAGSMTADTRTISVSNLGLKAGATMTVCEYISHYTTTTMSSDGSSYEGNGTARSQVCVRLTRPFEVTVTSVSNNVSNLYIGESGDYNYTVSVSGAPSEQVDLDGDGELEDPPTPTYRVFGLWVDTDGNDSDGNFLSGGTDRKAISGSASCSTIGATTSFVRSCEVLKEGSYASGTISGSGSIATPDEEAYVGAKYCVVVARNYFSADGDTFTGYEEGGDSWGVETISCGATYKKPNLRITGASAYASGSITSTIVNKTTNGYDSTSVKFGSWSEYLLVSGSTISNFASGAYYSIGNTSNSASYFSPLTIANTDTDSLGSSGIDTGSTTFIKKLDAYLAKLDSLASSSSTDTSSDSQGGISFTCNSSRGVCYDNSSGDVTISSNINSTTDRPIYIIRTSGSVYINSNVSYIDAWIIADGGVYTCSDVSSITNLSQNTCNQALTINGPVYASNLTAYRTAGANGVTSTQSSARTSDAESAETIHFPIKTYVWAYEESVTSDVRIYEASSTELAPRV